MREANRRKNKFKYPGEIIKIETVETSQGNVKFPVSVKKLQSSVRAAKKITKKYDKLRWEKVKKLAQIKGIEVVKEEESSKKYTKSAGLAGKKISDRYKKLRRKRNIDIVQEIKDVASEKSAQIAAKKVSDKYKKMRMKKPLPTFLVSEADLETIQYNDEPNENIFANESILAAASKVFDFDRYKKEQASKSWKWPRASRDNKLCWQRKSWWHQGEQ